mgnify:CR=1 FL=1
MNRNELQAMLHSSNEVRKLVFGSRECLDNNCDSCGYFAICQANSLLHELIGHEADKHDVKGELKHDNH